LEANGSKPNVWSYDDGKAKPKKTHGIYDFKKQIADPCWAKMHRPQWAKLVENCVNSRKMSDSLQDHYETETHRVNFSWTPAVFLNGTFHYKASHGRDLLTYLD